jgi:DNA polymerase (family 10)
MGPAVGVTTMSAVKSHLEDLAVDLGYETFCDEDGEVHSEVADCFYGRRHLWDVADERFHRLESSLSGTGFTLLAAGSYRRGRKTVKDLDCVVVVEAGRDLKVAASELVGLLPSGFNPEHHPRLGRIVRGTVDGMSYDLYLCHPDELPAMRNFLTGPREHNIWMRTVAKERGLKLNQYHLSDRETDIPVAGIETEDDLYRALELEPLAPHEREKFREGA